MRKLLFLSSLVLVLSACGLKSSDFTSLYNDHVHSDITAVQDFTKSLGLYKQEEGIGILQAAVNIPVLMSGALSLEHDTKINGRDADIALKNIHLAYESMMGSGSLSLDKLSLVSKNSDIYFLFTGLKDVGVLTEEIRTVVEKYTNTWLSWTQADINKSLSGATEEEVISNAIMKNASKLTLADIETYLKKYPIWKQTADLGMSGSIHIFAIDLNRESVLALATQVTKDFTNSGLTDTDKKSIQDSLNALTFSGTLGFDNNHADVAQMHLIISQSGGTELGVLDANTSKAFTQIHITSAATNTSIALTLTRTETRNEIQASVSESGTEIGKLSGYIEHNGDKLKEASFDITAQGVTASMKHIVKDDGTFVGNLQLPVGNITWNGARTGKKLTALTLKGTMPMGSVSMELIPQGDKIAGLLVVKEGNTDLFRANVGLLVDEGKFWLSVDILNTEKSADATPQAHIELNVTSKTSPYEEIITVPSPTQPLRTLLDELGKLAPKDSFAPAEQSDVPTIQVPVSDTAAPVPKQHQ